MHWNQISLACAYAAKDSRVQGFYPSLYLNIGKVYKNLGN